MHRETIEEDCELQEWIPGPDLFEECDELRLVHGLVEVGDHLDTFLLRNGRNGGDRPSVIGVDVRLGVLPDGRPIDLQNCRFGGAALVAVDDAVALLLGRLYSLLGLPRLLLDSHEVLWLDRLLDPDRLLLDACLCIS